MDYRWYYKTNRDSLLLSKRTYARTATSPASKPPRRGTWRSATDTMFVAYNGYSSGYHMIYDYAGTSKVTNLAWGEERDADVPGRGRDHDELALDLRVLVRSPARHR